MENLVTGPIGMVHLLASLVAMITGLIILAIRKGTTRHKRIGYIYVAMMLIVNVTAFMIYRLFGKFAIFHWFAVVSLITLIAGMVPIIRKQGKQYIITHFSFMYWSVVGLYAAFVSEVFTRLPSILYASQQVNRSHFFTMLNIAIVLVMGFGAFFFMKYKSKWELEFDSDN